MLVSLPILKNLESETTFPRLLAVRVLTISNTHNIWKEETKMGATLLVWCLLPGKVPVQERHLQWLDWRGEGVPQVKPPA